MKRRLLTTLAFGFAVLWTFTIAHAWNGDKWDSISRSKIESLAKDMIKLKWTPKKEIKNWEYGNVSYTFKKGKKYTGVAYSQNNPQKNLSEFKKLVENTSGGKTSYGNDCSGFVSICWKLPMRYTTAIFESDAASDAKKNNYVDDLGKAGDGRSVELSKGDAFVRSGIHIVLFKEKTNSGIKTMEQTPFSARYKEWSWSLLLKYRPITRRNLK